MRTSAAECSSPASMSRSRLLASLRLAARQLGSVAAHSGAPPQRPPAPLYPSAPRGARAVRAAASGWAGGAPSRRGGAGRAPPLAAASAQAADSAAPASWSRRQRSSDAGADAYDAGQIQVLQGLEPVRKRPGMYIGSTGQRGLHHLVYEILDNAIDEVQAGHATQVHVDLDLDSGWVTVTDDGRGIPTGVHPTTGKSALETVLTVLHAGGKFGGDASGYAVSGGLHGVGLSVVNALSRELEVSVWRGGRRHWQRYAQGLPQTPLVVEEGGAGEEAGGGGGGTRQRGTRVRFLYDDAIFSKSATFDPDTLRFRLRELAFLNSSAAIHFRVTQGGVPITSSLDDGGGGGGGGSSSSSNGAESAAAAGGTAAAAPEDTGWETYRFSGGLAEYVAFLNRDKSPIHAPIVFSKTVNGVTVEAALQWVSDAYSDTLVSFVNSVKTVDGGTHVDGLKAALTRTLNSLGRKAKVLKEGDPNLAGDHVREGLGAVVAVRVPGPEFEGQTKTRLGNPEVRRLVEGVVAAEAGEALEMDPPTLQAVLGKAVQAFRAAEAAKKARELVRRKSVLTKSTLPGKLADCAAASRAETEIFLVEGDSAGGSTKQARDRRFQAVLPLRGKILNVERQDDSRLYKNQEIANLIVALGLGLKGEDLAALRYGKVIILTDADVDGAHIRTLLLTFLFRYQRALFEQGHVYVGVPPLYRLDLGRGARARYLYSEAELKEATSALEPGSFSVQRFKGLGEMMPEQLWATTLDPARRTLRRLTLEDAAEASHVFGLLMGEKVAPRRALIERHGSRLALQDLDI